MRDGRQAVGHERGPRRLACWTGHSDLYLLPIVGMICLTLGVSLTFNLRVPWGPFAPLILMILGLGLVVNVIVGLAAWSVPPSDKLGPTYPSAVRPGAAQAFPSARSVDVAPIPGRAGSGESRARKPTGNSGSHADYHVSPGEYLWRSWVPPARKLPGELVGPVPETAYVPHREGAPSLYEEGEPVILASVKNEDRPDAGSRALLDAGDFPLFPSLTNALAREPEDFRAVRVQPPAPTTPAIGRNSVSGGALQRPASRAATDLRTAPSRAPIGSAVPAGAGRPGGEALHTLRCASCRQSVGESVILRRCFACLRRLCADCAAAGHRTREGVWCRRCAEAEHSDGLSQELARRYRPAADAIRRSTPPSALSSTAA